jgi:hypothetical protein
MLFGASSLDALAPGAFQGETVMKSFFLVVSAAGLVTAAGLTGCSGEPERAKVDPAKSTPTVAETERPGSNAPSDVNPVTAHLRISDLKVGTALGPDGKVADNTNLVRPGDTVHASVAVGDVGAGSKVKAVWLGPDGQRLGDEVKTVEAGIAYLAFRAPETSTWSVGDYKVEIYLGDELAASNGFDLVAQAPPA